MKNKQIDKGWVVASENGTFILTYTFQRTRKDAIEKWMSIWDKDRRSWRKFKREGYKCVKASQTTELVTV